MTRTILILFGKSVSSVSLVYEGGGESSFVIKYNYMMRRLPILLFALAVGGVTAMAQDNEKTLTVTVENTWKQMKKDEPVVLRLKDVSIGFSVNSATVWDGSTEIPSQLDDLNRDLEADELAFVVDIPADAKKTYKVVLSEKASDKHYPARVHAQMRLNDKSQKNPHVQYLTFPGTVPVKQSYSAMYHHGPAFESELVAFRAYFDNRQSIDLYGKKYHRLELAETNFYPKKEQLAAGYGDDVLWAGTSVGLGSFRGYKDGQPQTIDRVDSRSGGVLASGPVRTVVEFFDRNWQYGDRRLNMTQHYTLYAGHRDVRVDIRFKEADVKGAEFCTGVQKLERDNVGFLHDDGLAGSWGSNLAYKNDTVNHPRETVGLGVCVPRTYVVTPQEDDVNYLFRMNTGAGQELSYYFTFNALKEEKGFKDSRSWFAYLKKWQQALAHPCKITIR